MPMTLYPSDFSSAAVADESTPPDMATTTRVSCGRPSRSRLLRIPAAASAALLALSRLSETGPYYRDRLWPSNAGYPGGPTRQFLPDQRNPCRCLDWGANS